MTATKMMHNKILFCIPHCLRAARSIRAAIRNIASNTIVDKKKNPTCRKRAKGGKKFSRMSRSRSVLSDERPGPVISSPPRSVVSREFDVPVEVIAPAQGGVLHAEGHGDNRHPPGLVRGTDQPHLRLLGRPAALPVVAGQACSHDVLPGGLAALDLRYDMIEGQVFGWMPDPAILAG